MTSSEKFCLKWTDFQENIVSSYYDLRKDSEFSDVTLVCEANQQIEAHKIVLSACSPLLSTMLRMNKHSHPIIYMRGLKAKDLVAIMDFIYHGEASIEHDNLDVFLALAEELQLKGFAGTQENKIDPDEKPKLNLIQPTPKSEYVHEEKYYYQTTPSKYTKNHTSRKVESDVIVMLAKFVFLLTPAWRT